MAGGATRPRRRGRSTNGRGSSAGRRAGGRLIWDDLRGRRRCLRGWRDKRGQDADAREGDENGDLEELRWFGLRRAVRCGDAGAVVGAAGARFGIGLAGAAAPGGRGCGREDAGERGREETQTDGYSKDEPVDGPEIKAAPRHAVSSSSVSVTRRQRLSCRI